MVIAASLITRRAPSIALKDLLKMTQCEANNQSLNNVFDRTTPLTP